MPETTLTVPADLDARPQRSVAGDTHDPHIAPGAEIAPGLCEAVMFHGWEAFFNQLMRIFDHIDTRLAVLEHWTTYHLGRPKGLSDEEFAARAEFYGLVSAKYEMNHWPCARGRCPDDPELAAVCCCGPNYESTVNGHAAEVPS
jgi:hypothetical protein